LIAEVTMRRIIIIFFLFFGTFPLLAWDSYKPPTREQIVSALEKISKKNFQGRTVVMGWPLQARFANTIAYTLGIASDDREKEYAVLLDLNLAPMPKWVGGTLNTSASDRLENGLSKPIHLVTFKRGYNNQGGVDYSYCSYILPPGNVGLNFDNGGNAHEAPLNSLIEIKEISPQVLLQRANNFIRAGDLVASKEIIQSLVQIYPLSQEAKESSKLADQMNQARAQAAAEEANQEAERSKLQAELSKKFLEAERKKEIAKFRKANSSEATLANEKEKFELGKKLLWDVKKLVEEGDYEGATEKISQNEKFLSPTDPFLKEAKSLLNK